MSIFKQFNPQMVTMGPSRVAVKSTAVPPIATTGDPVNMPAIIDGATYAFGAGWTEVGATNDAINMAYTWAEQEISHNLSGGPFKESITSDGYNIDMNLTDLAGLSVLKLVWPNLGATSAIASAVGPPAIPAGRIAGLGVMRSKPHRSIVIVNYDPETDLKRAYYFRDVAPTAGDKQLGLTENLVTAPYALRAYKNTSANTGKEYGFIIEDDGWGGILNGG